MTYYVEWAPKVNARKGRMVTMDALEIISNMYDPGYRSVYQFEENDAIKIIDQGSSSGMNQYTVSSIALILDLDGGAPALTACEKRLKEHGLQFDVYSSGGKGYHVYIYHDRVTSIDLPYSHQKAVEELGIDTDMSLYQHGRLISMVGRVHPKTGNKKKYLYTVSGKFLDLKIVKRPLIQFNPNFGSDVNALSAGLNRFMTLTQYEPGPGNRHTAIWGASKDLIEAGLAYETVLDLALHVNAVWKNPKTDDEIRAAVEQAVG